MAKSLIRFLAGAFFATGLSLGCTGGSQQSSSSSSGAASTQVSYKCANAGCPKIKMADAGAAAPS